jgi:hypothetical protein
LSINKRLDAIVAGISSGLRQDSVYQNLNVALSGASQSNTLPSSGTFPIAYSTGWCRLKIYNGGGTSPTLTSLKVSASDGTNSVLIFAFNPSGAHNLSATSWFDECFDFLVDVAATGSGGGASGQFIALNGISSLTIATNLGGTSPTATLDAECLMAI